MCHKPIAPADSKQLANKRIEVAVMAPDDRFQHPDSPVQKAQKIVTKLNKINKYIYIDHI